MTKQPTPGVHEEFAAALQVEPVEREAHLRDLLYHAESYVIDGIIRAEEEAKMNAAYPMRSPRYNAALAEVRKLHSDIRAALAEGRKE
jgi:hypothetical protein